MYSTPLNYRSLAKERSGLILIALNLIGAVSYVIAASHGWVVPQERELHSVTGEPYIWALYVFPIWAVYILLNLIWGVYVLARHRRGGILWLMTIPIWLIAAAIDFAHH